MNFKEKTELLVTEDDQMRLECFAHIPNGFQITTLQAEIRDAINTVKSGKSAGEDESNHLYRNYRINATFI